MRKLFFTTLLCVLAATAGAQQKNVVLPGKGNINVETLNKGVNLNMDISKLTLSELRVLRNSFAAKQGYMFMNAELRSIFETTSWYSEAMYKRWEHSDDEGNVTSSEIKPITYTKAESEFMKKLKAREDELLGENFKAGQGMAVNMDNLINPFQMEEFDPKLRNHLGKYGFAIVPADELQLFHVYERNDYHDFPSFVTTDLFLQAFHMYFDNALKDVEQKHFIGTLTTLTKQLYDEMTTLAAGTKDKKLQDAAQWDAAYFAIAHALFTGQTLMPLSAKYADLAAQEVKYVKAATTAPSEFLEYFSPPFDYSTYRPRGHYTRTPELGRYFQGMMWLQNTPFGTDKPHFLLRAALMAQVIGNNADYVKAYNSVSDPVTFLMGQPDNVTILQVFDEMKKLGATADKLAAKSTELDNLKNVVEELSRRQTRINPKFLVTSPCKVNLMPQRYIPDAEVLQEMVDYETNPTKRDVPKGLDVMAAIGMTEAESILINELKEPQRWEKYTENLEKMKKTMGTVDWDFTVANQWINSLKSLSAYSETNNVSHDDLPYFMQTPLWDKKVLNTALASWAELKHDAILYAKQPAGAECGDGSPPEPIVKGYVEPNIPYYRKAIDLINATEKVLNKYGLMTEKITTATEDLRDKAEFLLNISKKELNFQKLSEEEYGQIEYIGASFEYITLNLIKEEDQWLAGWELVEGADKSISVVADVYTANAFNNKNKSVLYEAVGPAHEIYVVVEIDGYLYLTRGAVFSYREFQEDLAAPRKTDEEWQEELKSQPDKGIPNWMKEIIVPLKGKNIDNEYIFHSTGC